MTTAMTTDLTSILGPGATTVESPLNESTRAAGGDSTFDELLAKAASAVVRPQQEATKAVEAFNRGTEGRLHDTMLTLDKAEISLKLFVGVRNRLLDSYREIMKMGG